MAAKEEGELSSVINRMDKHRNTLLFVIECHNLFLANVQGNTDMTELMYQSISAKTTNWARNEELLSWLKSDDNRISAQSKSRRLLDWLTCGSSDDNRQSQDRRLNIILETFRDISEGQDHVANFIDGRNGEKHNELE